MCRDAQTSGVFLVALAVGVVVPAGASSADIWIGVRVPPNPVVPPPTEEVWRVQQPAPVNVQVVFVPNPGAPSVSVPNSGPPG